MSDRARRLHSSKWTGVFYITGGGSAFLSEILQEPGASKTVLEALVPYAENALSDLLGGTPDQACSMATARALAMTAYQKSQSYNLADCFGLGCTASLATDRVKKGKHRAYWSIQTATDTFSFSTLYSSDRQSEENQLVEDLWKSVEHTLFSGDINLPPEIKSEHQNAKPAWANLLKNQPYRHTDSDHNGLLLLPGSFNPLHEGHEKMLTIAEQICDRKGAYEISIRNADKPSLDFISIKNRLNQFENSAVWLTNTPTFGEKSALFPGATFAIGIDTVKRLGQARFYNNDPGLMEESFKNLISNNTRLLVFGRLEDGVFETLDTVSIPDQLRSQCEAVSEDLFRSDLSSTMLRQQLSEKSGN